MNQSSKDARRKLKKATRTEFESLVYDAMLTPMQERAIRLHIADCLSVSIISMRLAVSETSVRNLLTEVYEKVAKV